MGHSSQCRITQFPSSPPQEVSKADLIPLYMAGVHMLSQEACTTLDDLIPTMPDIPSTACTSLGIIYPHKPLKLHKHNLYEAEITAGPNLTQPIPNTLTPCPHCDALVHPLDLSTHSAKHAPCPYCGVLFPALDLLTHKAVHCAKVPCHPTTPTSLHHPTTPTSLLPPSAPLTLTTPYPTSCTCRLLLNHESNHLHVYSNMALNLLYFP